MKCQNCGAPVQIDFKLCPYCGASLEEAVSADDVYEKMDDMDDKLDDIHDRLKTRPQQNSSYQSQPKETSALGRTAQAIFFIVFICITLLIFAQACRMFTGSFGMGF